MRILNKTEFLKLPAGVLYCKYEPCIFDALSQKGETTSTGHDFWSFELNSLWSDGIVDTSGWVDALTVMETTDASFPLGDTETRHGRVDDDQLFLIYEKEDLLVLRLWIDKAIKSTPAL